MTFKLPNDNKLVDDSGRFLPQYRGAFEVIERLSKLSKDQLNTLLRFTDGFGNADAGSIPVSAGTAWGSIPIGPAGNVLTVDGDKNPKWLPLEEQLPPDVTLPDWSLIETKLSDGTPFIQFDNLNGYDVVRFEIRNFQFSVTAQFAEFAASTDGVDFNQTVHYSATETAEVATRDSWQLYTGAGINGFNSAGQTTIVELWGFGVGEVAGGFFNSSFTTNLGALRSYSRALKHLSGSPIVSARIRTSGGSNITSGSVKFYARNS